MLSLIQKTDPSWQPILEKAFHHMEKGYLDRLLSDESWLPGQDKLLAAFSLPLCNLKYILLGESPYPRVHSANGYAFWDASVEALWTKDGLSKPVNRATSLRNFVKMLLVARGDLTNDTSKEAIKSLDKSAYVQTGAQLFTALIDKGFLLLNASLVYSEKNVLAHAKAWQPFISSILRQLRALKLPLTVLLFGRIAREVPDALYFPCLTAEHPYNLSFMTNPDVLAFFKPLDLLSKHE